MSLRGLPSSMLRDSLSSPMPLFWTMVTLICASRRVSAHAQELKKRPSSGPWTWLIMNTVGVTRKWVSLSSHQQCLSSCRSTRLTRPLTSLMMSSSSPNKYKTSSRRRTSRCMGWSKEGASQDTSRGRARSLRQVSKIFMNRYSEHPRILTPPSASKTRFCRLRWSPSHHLQ